MSDYLNSAIIVAIVRIVAFGISGLLAYFGYRLFFAVPQQTESGGKIETLGLTITLTRIAPGTFFAICAAGIVIASFVYPITITPDIVYGSIMDNVEKERPDNSSVTSGQSILPDVSRKAANTAHVVNALRQLACVRDKYPYSEDQRTAIDHARVALMARIWQQKWGDFSAFEIWALEGRGKPPVTRAQDLFSEKGPRCTK